ncbi:MAG: FtsW/RodA/SpoVE family cell cycle protein, partial [Phycisphaeraceae bacterium]
TDTARSGLVLRQCIFLVAGMAMMVMVALPHHRLLVHAAYPLAIVSILTLAVLLLPFLPQSIIPVRNGARRWIDFQVVQVQPSELAKIAFVLALAAYLRYRQNYRTFLGLFVPFAITFVPMGLILVEPDLGTSLIFLPVFFAMLVAAGARLNHLILIVVLGVVATPLMYPLLQPHQKQRIMSQIAQIQGDTSDRDSAGFQAYKAMTTTGAGQFTGYGKERARLILRENALPEAHNDMIFAVIAARWGLAGGLGVLGLYFLLIGSALVVAARHKDPFARLIVVGVATIFVTQVFVNVGMTLGMLPITGMTLPLISYGGSSLVASMVMVGLVLGAAARRPAVMMAGPAFEYDTADAIR